LSYKIVSKINHKKVAANIKTIPDFTCQNLKGILPINLKTNTHYLYISTVKYEYCNEETKIRQEHIDKFIPYLSLLSLNTLKRIKDSIYVLENRTITSAGSLQELVETTN
jgi:hypothetical protein